MFTCSSCGTEYPSRHYFVTDSICKNCFEKLDEKEKQKINASIASLAKEEVSARSVDGHPLTCPVCDHDQFWKRQTLMNTPGMTFFGLDWANKQAVNYICAGCGYILWFMHEE